MIKKDYSLSRIYAFCVMLIFVSLCSAASNPTYTLTAKSDPSIGGTFNRSQMSLCCDEVAYLYAFSNPNFTFERWVDNNGVVVSTEPTLFYTMPDKNTELTAQFVYNPINPGEPSINFWDSKTGDIIVDSFEPGSLLYAIFTAKKNQETNDVISITIDGELTQNDLNIANYFLSCKRLDLGRVTGINDIPAYAFDNTLLENVYLPATIESIGDYAFSQCINLKTLTIYAMLPPSLGTDVVTPNLADNLIVFVPAAAIENYQNNDYWQSFTILPVQEDICSVTLSFQEDTDVTDYANMWLELTNKHNGQKLHCVINGNKSYTFNNIIRNTLWTATIRNERGELYGEIDNIDVKDKTINVILSSISKPQTVDILIETPSGENVTSDVKCNWFDRNNNYLISGTHINNIPLGYELNYEIILPEELAMNYQSPKKQKHIVSPTSNSITICLTELEQTNISGKVLDQYTLEPIQNAVATAMQTFAGKYTKSENRTTNNNGQFSFFVNNVPTSLSFSANGYMTLSVPSDSLLCSMSDSTSECNILLNPINGTVLTLSLNYRESVDSDKTSDESTIVYTDVNNIDYELYNLTKQKKLTDFIVQHPEIIIISGIDNGDSIMVSATSKNGAFICSRNSIPIYKDKKNPLSIDLLEPGKIHITYNNNSNQNIISSLYDSNGQIISTNDISGDELTISNLNDGDYVLISMVSADNLNLISNLNRFTQLGLLENSDYIRTELKVKSGKITDVYISDVPSPDPIDAFLIENSSSITANKSSVVVGNYLTFTCQIDIKPEVADYVDNISLIIDLPEGCTFVDNSVMVGTTKSTYSLESGRLNIPVKSSNKQARFCIIPTIAQDYIVSAYANFEIYDNDFIRAVGSTTFEAKELSIIVPPITTTPTFSLSGTTNGASSIEIYDGSNIIGRTNSSLGGVWYTKCELVNPYNLSNHNIHAKVTDSSGITVTSESKRILYNQDAIRVSKVTMNHFNPEMYKTYVSEFDFINPSTQATKWVVYYPRKRFTYTIEFTENNPDKIYNVILYVHTADGRIVSCPAIYNEKKNLWCTEVDMGSQRDNYYPVNCSVDFECITDAITNTSRLDKEYDEINIGFESIDDKFCVADSILNKITELTQKDDVDKDQFTSLMERYFIILGIGEDLIVDEPTPNFPPDTPTETKIEIINNILEKSHTNPSEEYQTLAKELRNPINEHIPAQTIDGTQYPAIDIYVPSPIIDANTGKANWPNSGWTPDYDTANTSQVVLKSQNGGEIKVDNLWKPDNAQEFNYRDWSKSCQSTTIGNINLISSAGGLTAANHAIFAAREIARLENNLAFDRLFLRTLLSFEADSRFINPELYIPILDDIKLGGEALGAATKTQLAVKTLSKTTAAIGTATGLLGVAMDVVDWVGVNNSWESLLDYLDNNCDNSSSEVAAIRANAEESQAWVNRRYIGKGVIDAVCTACSAVGLFASEMTAGTSLALNGVGFVGTLGSTIWEHNFSNSDRENRQNIINKINSIPSTCVPIRPDSQPSGRGGVYQSGCVNDGVQIDPSGYVYEAVPSNRIPGVQATIFYKEVKENMYGDFYEEIAPWDAEEYAQNNPLFTDEDGMYRWDVPQGEWQVKFEKSGYETAYSDWLPVPPPQLDVNIALIQKSQPKINGIHAYENVLNIAFDKYMQIETLNCDNVTVVQNGSHIKGNISPLNAESPADSDTQYASHFKFEADSLIVGAEVILWISNRVTSYAGLRMASDYQQTLLVEQEVSQILCDSIVNITVGETIPISVEVQPAPILNQRSLRIKSISPTIASTNCDQVIIGEDGMAQFNINGELPGFTSIELSLTGSDKTAHIEVYVRQPGVQTTQSPTANIATGTLVASGTEITLSSKTENAIIYYTIDGSCPCDDSANRYVYDGCPIVIENSMTVKAMAVAPNMYESDIVEFEYLVDATKIKPVSLNDFIIISPSPVKESLYIYANDIVINRCTLTSLDGHRILVTKNRANVLSLDVSHIPAGFYIVTVETNTGNLSKKIIKF